MISWQLAGNSQWTITTCGDNNARLVMSETEQRKKKAARRCRNPLCPFICHLGLICLWCVSHFVFRQQFESTTARFEIFCCRLIFIKTSKRAVSLPRKNIISSLDCDIYIIFLLFVSQTHEKSLKPDEQRRFLRNLCEDFSHLVALVDRWKKSCDDIMSFFWAVNQLLINSKMIFFFSRFETARRFRRKCVSRYRHRKIQNWVILLDSLPVRLECELHFMEIARRVHSSHCETHQLLCCSWCNATLNPNIDPSWPSCRM